MDATGIILAARDLGIRLSVTQENHIEYRPKSRMTPELLAEIKANKEELIRDVLIADAVRYLGEQGAEGGAGLSVPETLWARLGEARVEGDLAAERRVIQEVVRAGLRAIERARRAA